MSRALAIAAHAAHLEMRRAEESAYGQGGGFGALLVGGPAFVSSEKAKAEAKTAKAAYFAAYEAWADSARSLSDSDYASIEAWIKLTAGMDGEPVGCPFEVAA